MIHYTCFLLLGLVVLIHGQRDISACGCGERNTRRIVGGQQSNRNAYPWMVSVRNEKNVHICGGALINNLYVLTAAHCLVDSTPGNLSVYLGDVDVTKVDSSEQRFLVSNIIMHPNYNQPTAVNNDIGLMRLARPVVYNSNIKPVCLSPAGTDYTEEAATIAGWGAMREGGKTSPTLREITMNVIDDRECNSSYGRFYNFTTMMCFGTSEGGRDTCQGDSGGPLVFQGDNGRYIHIGVVSFGRGCARKGFPGVYTDVSNYISWIADNTRDATYCQGSSTSRPVVTTTRPSTTTTHSEALQDICGRSNEFRPRSAWTYNGTIEPVGVIEIQPRIHNGNQVNPNKYPWTAVIISNQKNVFNYDVQCGATLISQRWLVTAAHCVERINLQNLFVVLGDHSISRFEGKESMLPVKQVVFHPGYKSDTWYNHDLALLRVEPVTFTREILPVCLPPASWNTFDFTGFYGIAAGWGATQAGSNQFNDVLLEGIMRVVPNSACSLIYGSTVITDRNMCCKGDALEDICSLDAGGPFIINSSDNRYRLLAVTTFSSARGCGKGDPTGFTRVNSYLQWIIDNTDVGA